jgi:hypothetical protein
MLRVAGAQLSQPIKVIGYLSRCYARQQGVTTLNAARLFFTLIFVSLERSDKNQL